MHENCGERIDAGCFGPMAPVLQLHQQLFATMRSNAPRARQAPGASRRRSVSALLCASASASPALSATVDDAGSASSHFFMLPAVGTRIVVDACMSLTCTSRNLREFLGAGCLERARVLRQHVIAMRDHRLQRVQVAPPCDRSKLDCGATSSPSPGRSISSMRMYIQPMSNSYHCGRELGRRGVGVMIVVQLLAADEDAPRNDVGAARLRVASCGSPSSGRCR